MKNITWIKNAKQETGHTTGEQNRVQTTTDLFDILIADGKVAKVVRSSENELPENTPIFDAKKQLLLPSFKDMHIHLDKTYYGGPWKACIPFENIFTRIEEEQYLLPQQLPKVQERAEGLFHLLLSNGVTEVRTHCNIDQAIGLKNLEATVKAAEKYKDKVDCKIVAFPQHGLLRSDVVSLMREAMDSGADLVGGLDPGNVDLDIEKSLQTMMELAVESDSDIDIHLHDPGHLGLFTMKRIASLTEEIGWQNRVTISHALGLSEMNDQELQEIASRFNSLGINLASVVSSRNNSQLIPIPTLKEYGVNTLLGTDTVMDHWSPFGQGNVLEKLSGMAEYFRLLDEKSLAQSLGYITGGITPLDKNGNQVWPVEGDAANFALFDATCSAEVVARKPKSSHVISRGNLVFNN